MDAFHVDDIDEPDEPDDDNSDNASDANALTRRPPRRTPGDAASLQGDSLCNNCLGFGHHRDKCPSTKKDRKMSDVIIVLTSIEARKARTASTAPPPPNRPHRRVQIKGRRNQTYAVDLADDGQMYIPDTDTPVDTDYLDGKTDDKPDGMHFDVVPDTDADPPPKIESEADPDFDSLFDTALLDAAASGALPTGDRGDAHGCGGGVLKSLRSEHGPTRRDTGPTNHKQVWTQNSQPQVLASQVSKHVGKMTEK